ncbi:MAG: HAD family hydrolase [Desulfovibrionaceae bacterium]|nr:HAD family hydrolase [Desulfovibrionaceae bacterium]MBF0514267.1 HAD family hydrolase [Desulfovibrionaceae bacterium]
MSARAVIFDLDGTLLDTLCDLADTGNAVLAAMGHPTHPIGAYRMFVGGGLVELVRRILPLDAANDHPRALELMRAEYARRWKAKTRPYPGVPEMLGALVAREVSISVLSNKPDPFCKLTVEHFFGRLPWAALRGETKDFPPKPDSSGALAISRELGVAPGEFLFVGDSPMDVQCALGAGMTPVGVTWGFRERSTLETVGGKLFIDEPGELPELI